MTDVDTRTFNILSLCTGGGGLDLGVSLAVPASRVVCCIEREAYCCEVLAARMEEEALDDAPVWTDLRTFDGKPWRGVVDGIIGGIPCQPWSVAGKRAGQADDRDLWPEAARIIGEVEPELVFLENVPGILVPGGFDRMASTLREMGYAVAAGLFSAAETGATHRRLRLFILANRPTARGRGNGQERGQDRRAAAGRAGEDVENPSRHGEHGCVGQDGRRGRRGVRAASESAENPSPAGAGDRPGAAGGRRRPQGIRQGSGQAGAVRADAAEPDVADSPGGGRREDEPRPQGGRCDAAERGEDMVNATGGRPGVRTHAPCPREGFGADWGSAAIPIFPPGPADLDAWREVLQVAPSLEPALCGVADGLAPRVDRLRMLGNGVVPLQAAYAFCSLYAALTNDRAVRERR